MGEEKVTGPKKQEPEMPDYCRLVAEFSPMPMAAVTGPGHLLRYVNLAFCLLTGKTKEELIGNPFSEAVTTGGECLSLLGRVYRTGTAEIHTGQGDPAAHRFYWSYVMWPLLASDGSPAGIMIQVTETSPFLLRTTGMNQALMLSSVHQHELTEAAVKLNEELQRANDDLKQFAFAASHDLQEPLRMITSFSQLLIKGYRGQLDGEAEVCVGFIHDGTTHMQNLLADLLSYTEASAEKGERGDSIDLNKVFDQVTQNLRRAIDESGAVVTSGDLPIVHGQEARFVQLFQNLIGNAIKYHGPAPPIVQVSAERRNNEWLIAVADNGIGIEPEHHQTIFGVFKRLHGKAIPGTGIGLAISQRVVERYGGRIWVESKVGLGTTFYFTVPMNEGKS
jgi:signal transduction histidine kinase